MDKSVFLAKALVKAQSELAAPRFFGYDDEPEFMRLKEKSRYLRNRLVRRGISQQRIDDIMKIAGYFPDEDGGASVDSWHAALDHLLAGINQQDTEDSPFELSA